MNRLKDLREERDLKQAFIANLLEIKQCSYSQYEIETRDIPIKHLITLCKLYNTSIDYILYRTDERKAYSDFNLKDYKYKNRLKDLRNSLGKSQRDISIDLSFPKSTYIKYENGAINLTLHILSIFADYYNTSIDYIVCNTNDIVPYKKSIVDWKETQKK